MAKYYDSSGKTCAASSAAYAIVVKGDTLWRIATEVLGAGNKYPQIASWNNISNPNYIVVGQRINLNKTSSSSSTTPTPSNNTVTIDPFGPLASNDKKIYARWTWDKMSQTEKFLLIWRYWKDGVYFDSNTTSISVDQEWHVGSLQTTYDIPDGATSVHLKVKPVSLTYKVKQGDKEVEKTHWTANWTDWKDHIVSNPVTTPSAPSKVDIDENNQLIVTLENQDTSVYTHFKFEIVQNDTTLIATSGKLALNEYGYVTYPYNVASGNNYKVRCMGYKGSLTSEWSPFSSSVQSKPSKPLDLVGKIMENDATGKHKVTLTWKAVISADTYDIQYVPTDKDNFDAVGGGMQSASTSDDSTTIDILLDPDGKEYFFRVRAKNEKGESDWSNIVSVISGSIPGIPTTWESTTRVIVGEPLNLYWVHNSLDSSSQTYAQVFLSTDNGKTSKWYIISNNGYYRINANSVNAELISEFTEKDEKDQTSILEIDTASYGQDTTLTWWVQTAGITKVYGKTSTPRAIKIYEKPSLDLLVTDDYTLLDDGSITLGSNKLETLSSFPFYIKAVSGNTSQVPIGYSLSITANNSYNTVDTVGNDITISAGDEVYSRYFDISEVLVVRISADNVDLENGVEYTVNCTVSMNSGLTATAYSTFNVIWSGEQYSPNAEIAINLDTYTASIRPYCEDRKMVFKQIDSSSGVYIVSDIVINPELLDDAYTSTYDKVYVGKANGGSEVYYSIVYTDANGNPYPNPIYYKVNYNSGTYTRSSTRLTAISNIYTETGEQVLIGVYNNSNVRYCETVETTLVEDVSLSVYRREFDGSFTEIATDLSNVNNTFVIDPHPALDFARYRIVAKANTTGAISYYDLPGHPVGCSSIIIQWDEEWSSFDKWSDDALAEPPWVGSLLKLPYNVDESDSTNPDVTLVKYVGRKRPVSYHGTQLGETASWSSTIDKSDKETIYALRRLSIWCGNVYVRSPSGVGYWATVKPSFSLKHCDVTVPVTLDITRVEGGI